MYFINMSLRPRLVIFYLASILIPLAAFGGILYRVSIDEVESEMKKVSLQSVIQVNKVFDEYVNQIDKISLTLYIDKAIPEYLRVTSGYSENDSVRDKWEKREAAYNYIENLMTINPDVWSISAVSLNRDIITLSKNGSERAMFDFYQDEYYKALRDSTGNMTLLSMHKTNYMFSPSRDVFTLGRRYLDSGSSTSQGFGLYIGYILVECSKSVLDRICGTVKISNDGYTLILDNEKNILYSTQKGGIYKNENKELAKIYSNSGFNGVTTVDGKKIVLVSNTSQYTGWTVVGVIPYSEVIQRGQNIKNVFILLSIVCIIMVLAASALISRGVTKPIKNLQKAMSEFEKGNTEVQVHIHSYNEVGELSLSFNRLIEKVNNLIMSIRSIEIKKREAELDVLRSQINPHFLYNTLDSIRMMALIEDKEQIASAVKALADLFRYSIKQRKDIVEIKFEVMHVKNYIHLQKIRYGKRFDVIYDIDEDTFVNKTLKFTLQPIVENAIIHGLEKKRGKGLLTIRVKRHENHILFAVEDNGIGMGDEKLGSLMADLKEYGGEDNGSLGLKNINERLNLYFGPDCGLVFESKLGEGTKVQFKVPIFSDEGWAVENVISIFGRR